MTAEALTASGHSPIVRSGTALNNEDVRSEVFSIVTVEELFALEQQS